MTAQEAIGKASSRISRRDAETLLVHLVQRDRAWLLAHPEAVIDDARIAALFDLVERRAAHWPMQYLTGHQEFFGLDLRVSPDVLIPRPETELLVEAVLEWARRAHEPTLEIVDVGTGSGAIALALAAHLPEAEVTAVDLSPHTRPVVEDNAQRLGLSARIRFLESDLLAVFAEEIAAGKRFDVVASNPPYVPFRDAPEMQAEVRDFEPHLALFAEDDGLAIYRRLIPQAWDALRAGGLLAMEFGFGQRSALAELLRGWDGVRFLDDYAGIPRVALAERP